jgi:pimeloyl-ACP methyl ester carboxylesterase
MQEREIDFTGKDGFRLKGTLLLPPGPVLGTALIIAGSGPTDRNGNSSLASSIPGGEHFGEIHLYREIAEQYAARGIATFRFDKRACATAAYKAEWARLSHNGAGFAGLFSFSNIVDDAEKAAEALAAQPESKNLPLSLIGHSEGGLAALMIADRRKDVDTLYLLATGGRKMRAVLNEQFYNRCLEQTGDRAISEFFARKADEAMQALIDGKPIPQDAPQGLKLIFQQTTHRYFAEILEIDPIAIAGRLKSDVVVVNGTGDMQIHHERDAEPLYKAFSGRAANTARQEIVKIDGASHCFKIPKHPYDEVTSFKGPAAPQLFTKLDPFIRGSRRPR